MIERFGVSRDDTIYEAFPDVALTRSGKLVCVFAECTHHADRSYTRIVMTASTDRGRTWSPKRGLSEAIRWEIDDPDGQKGHPFWNCPRITTLSDGRLVVVVDRVGGRDEARMGGEQSNWLWFSEDEGQSWNGPSPTPVYGIVPDRLIELRCGAWAGRWLLSAHTILGTREAPLWAERCWLSDDKGTSWRGPFTIAAQPGLQLCEGSVLELPGGELVCFMRENSGRGLDCFKSISLDGGESWEGVYKMPIPACHRPVAGLLNSGKVLIT
ncbi:MAG: exo-alpha-sialidase, partial [Chloroflexi bacterium]|nr:exo-alpha-sialidase [Chloroflexota bacterium]